MKGFTLGNTDLKKIGKGALIAVIGALLTYFTTVVTNTNFGLWTPAVVAFWSIFTNTAWKVLDNQVIN